MTHKGVAVLVASIVFVVLLTGSAFAHIPPSAFAQYQTVPLSYEQALRMMGQNKEQGMLWNQGETYYTDIIYGNGVFVGESHALTPVGAMYEGLKTWGKYRSGEWYGVVAAKRLMNFFYGEYGTKMLQGEEVSWWSATSLSYYNTVWGLGVNLFS